MRTEPPPVPQQREETMESHPASPLRAKALQMEHETDWESATHIERLNPSWGANGGWVPGTGIPHHYDAQAVQDEIEDKAEEARLKEAAARIEAEWRARAAAARAAEEEREAAAEEAAQKADLARVAADRAAADAEAARKADYAKAEADRETAEVAREAAEAERETAEAEREVAEVAREAADKDEAADKLTHPEWMNRDQ